MGRVENVDVLASELGYKVGTFPSSYLGLLLGLHIIRWGFGRQPLCDAFSGLYSIATKGAKAAEIWVREDGGGA